MVPTSSVSTGIHLGNISAGEGGKMIPIPTREEDVSAISAKEERERERVGVGVWGTGGVGEVRFIPAPLPGKFSPFPTDGRYFLIRKIGGNHANILRLLYPVDVR
ncbi:hypothetical protein GWI33_012893 [Rhynchophorus ferrugineus]|uniref:Uncharacterized protein n=1 Tax=Rhynchophorus ferrugineus TaxID=354439 RepID=A0A834IAT8_RHYFE|nr:hypothetical protein GWI33_012893 [Rhynchophorus ferrugineus]